ncbi:type I-E CRISPR-associated protein Cas7/Cse4/CasC [Erwinia amylovora]|uniref:type I-E CRISPR-associated protein Cas7/Cse4/CasC n=1 Tax=Erwinia amylovora TaxID=552 RepID=UPI0014449848|nr:type I-E CRISPR-associated protein Cas7/Cse4/CasC [Erwinia amylovora]
MNNFINCHVLISHSPSCLNRDDMNMQKDAVFGGKRRVRISSQSLKRAIRKSAYYQQHLGESSMRTIHLADLRNVVHARLADKYAAGDIDKALSLLSGKAIDGAEKIDGGAVSPWVMDEIDWFCQQVAQPEYADFDEKKWTKLLKEQINALRGTLNNAVDVALSGRMATSGLMSEVGNVDGAMSLAHAITTHAVEADIDWFTAVDDLKETTGAAHLGTQEFSSGVFYRYASLNLSQLQQNLGGASREQALTIAAHLVHMLATEIPGAKQHSFAAFNPADLVMVNFSDFPLSLANAFEQPVVAKRDGFLQPSMAALNDYWARVAAGYGIDGPTAQFNLAEVAMPAGVQRMAGLAALKTWVSSNGEG